MVSRLEQYIEDSFIDATIIEVSDDVKSAKKAANALNTDKDNIIKSLVFKADNQPLLVIVPGPARVDEEKLASVFEVEDVTIASPDEVEEATGYEIGEVPPIGVDIQKVIDETVLDKDVVYGGGGSRNRMVKLDPRCIVDETARIAEVIE